MENGEPYNIASEIYYYKTLFPLMTLIQASANPQNKNSISHGYNHDNA